jgi:hypothetical protein
MAVIEKIYEGGDLIVPRSLLLEMGVKPGEAILIRPKADLCPVEPDVSVLEALDGLYGSWSDEDEAEFERARKEMWAGWHLPNLS